MGRIHRFRCMSSPMLMLNETMKKSIVIVIICALSLSQALCAQTARSLFMKSDGKQVPEIFSDSGNEYKTVGHHGPAVENAYMALRIYFNDSGAIDVYSKTGRGMELEKYGWYPTEEEQRKYGLGCDEYLVGKTVGLGGIALWDGEKEVKLKATRGRLARVGDTKKGCYAEMISYGVPYCGDTVDVRVRIDVTLKTRVAKVTAEELSGKKVRFLTGVNYPEGAYTVSGDGYICVWGVHPADVSDDPCPVGGGMFFRKGDFGEPEKTEDMIRIVSGPVSRIQTGIVSASTKEAELNSARRFESYMSR